MKRTIPKQACEQARYELTENFQMIISLRDVASLATLVVLFSSMFVWADILRASV